MNSQVTPQQNKEYSSDIQTKSSFSRQNSQSVPNPADSFYNTSNLQLTATNIVNQYNTDSSISQEQNYEQETINTKLQEEEQQKETSVINESQFAASQQNIQSPNNTQLGNQQVIYQQINEENALNPQSIQQCLDDFQEQNIFLTQKNLQSDFQNLLTYNTDMLIAEPAKQQYESQLLQLSYFDVIQRSLLQEQHVKRRLQAVKKATMEKQRDQERKRMLNEARNTERRLTQWYQERLKELRAKTNAMKSAVDMQPYEFEDLDADGGL